MSDQKQNPFDTPDFEYKPSIGGIIRGDDRVSLPDAVANSYADIDSLRKRLSQLKVYIQNLIKDLEKELNKKSLVITQLSKDSQLREANESTWPSNAESGPPSLVSYGYYKILTAVDSVGARYIRRRFEDASRGITGDATLDLLQLVQITNDEAKLISQFLDQYVGNVDDSSEFRVLELLQDWTETAIINVSFIKKFFLQKDSTANLPSSEIAALDTVSARQSQALFHFKMNSLNEEIVSHLLVLRRNFSDYAETFYDTFLGPAVKMRLQGTRTLYPMTGILGSELLQAKGSAETHLTMLLADQLRRNKTYDEKTKAVIQLINMRDTYRGYIHQLSNKGKIIQNGDPGTLVSGTVEHNIIKNAQKNLDLKPASLKPDHAQLSGVVDNLAHPQYLLKSGGKITGNIDADSGVKIAGVDLPNHAHTGFDGSSKIDGSNIAEGTLRHNAVDSSSSADAPIKLKIVNELERSHSDSVSSYDIKIAWDANEEEGTTFEVWKAVLE